ncbi:MAG: HNH endonuclease [Anaerolineales bacterium]
MNKQFTIKNAREEIKKKDEKSARSILSEIIQRNPQDKEAWILLAQIVVEPDQIVDCLEKINRIDPDIKGLSQRIEFIKKGPLKYYHQMIDIIRGYGEWAGEAPKMGRYEVNITIKNDLVEINNALATLKKQRKHLEELLKIITEDKDSFNLNPTYFKGNPPTFEAEKILYIKLSKNIISMEISQAIKQIEKSTFAFEIHAEKKMRDNNSEKPEYSRFTIPEDVKLYVWKRDQGRCVKCGSQINLEYDHIIPVDKGGSNTARNIQLLCEACNRRKGDKII